MKKFLLTIIIIWTIIFFSFSTTAQERPGHSDQFFLDMGYQSGIGDFASDYYNMQLTYGRYRTPLLFYGVGSTFRLNQLSDDKIVGAFINTKSRLIPKYEPLLIDIGIGYNYQLDRDFTDGGILFFAGIQNETQIDENLKFHFGVSYDVMRIIRFGELFLYRSYNAKIGISF